MNTPPCTLNGEDLPFVPILRSARWPLIKGDLQAVWELMLKDQAAIERAFIHSHDTCFASGFPIDIPV